MDSQYSWRFDSTRSCTLRKKRLGQVVVVTKKSKYGQRSKQRREMSTAHSCHQQQCWNVQSNFFVHYLIAIRSLFFLSICYCFLFKNNLIGWKIRENVANKRKMSTAHRCHQQQCWNVQSNFFVHYLIAIRIFTIFWVMGFFLIICYCFLLKTIWLVEKFMKM